MAICICGSILSPRRHSKWIHSYWYRQNWNSSACKTGNLTLLLGSSTHRDNNCWQPLGTSRCVKTWRIDLYTRAVFSASLMVSDTICTSTACPVSRLLPFGGMFVIQYSYSTLQSPFKTFHFSCNACPTFQLLLLGALIREKLKTVHHDNRPQKIQFRSQKMGSIV